MDTQAIANRLVELYNAGTPTKAEEELYHQEVVSYEQDPAMEPTRGLSAIIAKTTGAMESIAESRTNTAETVLVNHDSFLVIYDLDVTFKNGYILAGKEYGFYRVKDGKVSEEYFFVQPK